MSKTHISLSEVEHIAELASLQLSDEQKQTFPTAFDETLAVIDKLQAVDVTGIEPTYQVTGQENVLREDVVRPEYMFSQAEALAGAVQQHDGYIVVPAVLHKEEAA